MDFLLNMFGVKATGSGRVADAAVTFHGVWPVYVLVAAAALGVMVYFMYRRVEELSTFRRVMLTSLRGLFLLLILGLLLRPVLSVTFEHLVRRTLLVVVDTSGSMSQIKDQRRDEADLKRAAIAQGRIDPAQGLSGPLPQNAAGGGLPTRLEIVKSALSNDRIDLLRRLGKDYDVAVYTFDEALKSVPEGAFKANLDKLSHNEGASLADLPKLGRGWVAALDAQGKQTAMGDAIRQVINQNRGQPLAGVLLVTDGANNKGVGPDSAAKLAGQDGVPLYMWGVGITRPKDIIVARHMLAQEVAFAKDEVPITVRVRSMGMSGHTARLQVKLVEDKTNQDAEKTEKEVLFNADGEQLVTVNITPRSRGEYRIVAGIPARDDEVLTTNNEASQNIRIIDDKIKVLFIEQFPRWEFKYAQAILGRDRRVDLKCLLFEGHSSISTGPNSMYLSEFPRQKEDLLKYDLVILGDVDPKYLSPSQVDMLGEAVSKHGVAFVVLAGKRHTPTAYRNSPIEKMLPVELELADTGGAALATRAIKPELTPAGRASLMLRLGEKELDSVSRWSQLPPLYWVARVARATPGADVLVVDPDPSKASRNAKMPVIAMRQYGVGQVLFIGTDNLWRWRRNAGDRYHALFWGQVVQRMALQHMLGASKRTQITSDQKEYTTGQPVTVFARLYTDGYDPMTEPAVNASFWDTGTNVRKPMQFRLIPEQPGMYRGELLAPAPGTYRVAVSHDEQSFLEFLVTDPVYELAEPAMNEPLLQRMAAGSGGLFLREEDLNGLPQALGEKAERKRSTVEVEMWSSPFYFLLMMAVVTAEWIVRKMSQLK